MSIEVDTFSFSVPGSEDFELGIGDWSVDNGLWEVGVPIVGPSDPHSGSKCAGTVLQADYPSYSNTRLVSPRVEVPGASRSERVWLKFWHWFVTENGDDLGRVQISTDDGATWVTVTDPLYEGRSEVWTQAAVDISDYAGLTVRFGFYFTSDSNYNDYAGWYLDDMSIEVGYFGVYLDCDDGNPEGFESGIGDWSVDNGLWEVGSPIGGPGTAHTGSSCAGTVLAADYPSYSNTRLVSPYIGLVPKPGETPELRFWHWFRSESGDDLLKVQIRPLGGVWQDLDVQESPFSGNGGPWTHAYGDLSIYANMTVQIGFYFTSDSNNNDYAGWYVDDISIHGTIDTPVEGAFFASLTESGSVMLRWTVGSLAEIETFHICRATSPEGPFVRINDEPLAPSSPGLFEDTTTWPQTTFWYELRALLWDGSEDVVGHSVATVSTGGRLATELYHARPNPSAGATVIQFDVAEHLGPVRLAIYNARGQLVRRLRDGPTDRGRHAVRWDGCDERGAPTASGVYFARLEVGGQASTRKILILR